MLKLLLIVPLLGILPLFLINSDSPQSVSATGVTTSGLVNKDANSLMKQIALGASLITLLISVVI
jgi:hypothetical protein